MFSSNYERNAAINLFSRKNANLNQKTQTFSVLSKKIRMYFLKLLIQSYRVGNMLPDSVVDKYIGAFLKLVEPPTNMFNTVLPFNESFANKQLNSPESESLYGSTQGPSTIAFVFQPLVHLLDGPPDIPLPYLDADKKVVEPSEDSVEYAKAELKKYRDARERYWKDAQRKLLDIAATLMEQAAQMSQQIILHDLQGILMMSFEELSVKLSLNGDCSYSGVELIHPGHQIGEGREKGDGERHSAKIYLSSGERISENAPTPDLVVPFALEPQHLNYALVKMNSFGESAVFYPSPLLDSRTAFVHAIEHYHLQIAK